VKEVNKELVPKNLIHFEKMFSTEEQCVEYLIKLKYGIYKCPICKCEKYWVIRKYTFKCCSCGYRNFILEDTIFEYKKKTLLLYYRTIWYVVSQKNGSNAMNIQRILGLGSYNTAWAWLQKLRRSMVRMDVSKLSGTVEVDESYLGCAQKGGKRGRGSENKIPLIVGVELPPNSKELGRIRLRKIPNCGAFPLENFVIDNVEKGSTVITDGWNGYSKLESKGYKRIIEEVEEDQEELQHVHLIISLLKRWLLGTMQGSFSEKYIDYYLDEFVFRFNRRKSKDRGLLFYRLMEIAVSRPPTTVNEIKANEKRARSDQR